MSNTPAVLSSDLGDSLPRTTPVQRPHPARLQHSPSLPNIWFPPRSGPSLGDTKLVMQPPSAPSSPKLESSAPACAHVSDKSEARTRHVKYASIDPVYRKENTSASKTHARRRTERDEPHSLLTPPLTPSSSIRTSASRDSGAESVAAQQGLDDDKDETRTTSEEVVDSDPESTRILLFGNVNRLITVEALETAICSALKATAVTVANSTKSSSGVPTTFLRQDPAIRGVNQRYIQSEGIVPVVFFDVRAAKIIQDLAVDSTNGKLREVLSESAQTLSAQLVSIDDLSKKLGSSTFLESIDGYFYLKVQKVVQTPHLEPGNSVEGVVEDLKNASISVSKRENDVDSIRGSINGALLHSLLKSFGSIRSFTFTRQEVNDGDSTSLIYRLEYHDSRDAEIAYNELQGYAMFGMKLSVFGKCEVSSRAAPIETISFPTISSAEESLEGLSIASAGSQSEIRTRFCCPSQECGSSDAADGQHATLQFTPVSNGAPSPTFFYTSPFAASPTPGPYDQTDLRLAPRGPEASFQSGQPSPRFQERRWENESIYRSDTVSPCYSSEGICLYCPSKGAPNGVPFNSGFGHYGLTQPPPFPPSMYYPNHIPTPNVQHTLYEYMDPQLQPVQSPPWVYDPSMASITPGPNGMPPMAMNRATPAPYFIREDTPMVNSIRQYHHAYAHTPEPPHYIHHPPNPVEPLASPMSVPAGEHKIGCGGGGHLVTPRSSSPSSHRSVSHLQHESSVPSSSNDAASGGRLTAGVSDRNQLNLAKIGEGGDTRSTVMIKNIPNKMSDADLTAYIGKVCPRGIDFLYLRMDFQNGCNVGYAFVNFIRVQDLLRFAKARLGEKWNMFSSEKVLQMSYANYQGKEALVEKFKNSAIMDERESWRPRIFYSSGTNQGLPEPFPAPTHIRRKERSSYNRGALFVPGVNGHGGLSHPHGLLHNTGRRYQEDYRPPRDRQDRHVNTPRRDRQSEGTSHSEFDDRAPAYRSSSYRATR